MSIRSSNWCFTAFEQDPPAIWRLSFPTTYICWGEEKCPKTGKLHYQGYLELNKRQTLGSITKMTEDATGGRRIHWEVRKAKKASDAIDYCAKRGKHAYEDGEDYGRMVMDEAMRQGAVPME